MVFYYGMQYSFIFAVFLKANPRLVHLNVLGHDPADLRGEVSLSQPALQVNLAHLHIVIK
jgi:hypothetical protein